MGKEIDYLKVVPREENAILLVQPNEYHHQELINKLDNLINSYSGTTISVRSAAIAVAAEQLRALLKTT